MYYFLKSLLVICLVCMSIGCTMVSASDLGLANSKIVELGSFGSNGKIYLHRIEQEQKHL